MKILAIETSCDDTCCAILNNYKVLSHARFTQESFYQQSTGVIPQIATQQHLKQIDKVIAVAVANAKIKLTDIDFVAYTHEPGLKPSLFVGAVAAQAIAGFSGAKLLPLNHLQGHTFSIMANCKRRIWKNYPILSLVISGGHSSVFIVKSPNKFKIIAETADDSIGECFDKIGSSIGFLYPGGRNLDEYILKFPEWIGRIHESKECPFPTFYCDKSNFRFSFSGIKSHCMRLIKSEGKSLDKARFIFLLFECAYRQLRYVVVEAARRHKISEIWISGGVSASEFLRICFTTDKLLTHLQLRFPDRIYSADNAVMIGALAYNKIIFNEN